MKHYIIPIFIPHWGCPHQCVFCSQNQITGYKRPVQPQAVETEIQAGLARLTHQRKVEVAFYGGSFTALPLSVQAELLKPAFSALQAGQVHSIRLSTRPDCINSAVIKLLKQYGVKTVELGVQSLDDKVLVKSARGHTAFQSLQALRQLRQAGFNTVAQLMVGLPGETWASLILTAKLLTQAAPDAIRIYPAVVLPNTPLAKQYQAGLYRPLSLKEAIAKSAYLKWQAERCGISVIRIGLQATTELNTTGAIIAGPYHPAFGEMVAARLFYLMVARVFDCTYDQLPATATIYHHPHDHSKVRGLANYNRLQWQQRYGIVVNFQADNGLPTGQLVINMAGTSYKINSSILFDL